jgi:RHS repeat-associated protein
VQKTQNYPSGTPLQENFGAGEQPLKFTGKELITMHGLNCQDFGARWLDNARMQWTSIDPLAEMYYNVSPYAYCVGNPVNNIDPFGLDVWTTSDPRLIGQFLAANKSKSSSFEVKGKGWTHFSHKEVFGDGDTSGILITNTEHPGFYIQYGTYTGTFKDGTFDPTVHRINFHNIIATGDPDSNVGLDGTYNLYTANENKKAFKYSMNIALSLLLGPAYNHSV